MFDPTLPQAPGEQSETEWVSASEVLAHHFRGATSNILGGKINV